MAGDDIHLPLDDYGHIRFSNRLFRPIKPEEHATLVIDGSLRAIDILAELLGRFLGRIDAGRESDCIAVRVADREHQAVAETIILPAPETIGIGFALDA